MEEYLIQNGPTRSSPISVNTESSVVTPSPVSQSPALQQKPKTGEFTDEISRLYSMYNNNNLIIQTACKSCSSRSQVTASPDPETKENLIIFPYNYGFEIDGCKIPIDPTAPGWTWKIWVPWPEGINGNYVLVEAFSKGLAKVSNPGDGNWYLTLDVPIVPGIQQGFAEIIGPCDGCCKIPPQSKPRPDIIPYYVRDPQPFYKESHTKTQAYFRMPVEYSNGFDISQYAFWGEEFMKLHYKCRRCEAPGLHTA